ncbi:DUF6457 domain-containing protein [Streptomyces albus subsp. chlorinus]|nr:DUF6457 domain-containing protein [Streptomyces albus]
MAGGGASRLGGTDKPAVTVGGRTLLDRVLAACADAAATVVVGPRRAAYRPVRWARESPPGGGPLAALHAGLEALAEDGAYAGPHARAERRGWTERPAGAEPHANTERPAYAEPHAPVLVVSADLPFLTREAVRTLLAVPPEFEGAVAHDGRDQPLLAAYRMEPLRRELALLRTEYGPLSGLPLRMVLDGLKLHRVTEASAPHVAAAALDCDTWDDIATARARIREHDTVLDEWMDALKAELGVELDVDTAVLLDLARDAAHGVARPAAPLTTFLVGYAAARAGASPQDVARAAATASRLAGRWADETADGPGGGSATADGDTGHPGNPGGTGNPANAGNPGDTGNPGHTGDAENPGNPEDMEGTEGTEGTGNAGSAGNADDR